MVFACYESGEVYPVIGVKIPSYRVVNYAKYKQAVAKIASSNATQPKPITAGDLFTIASSLPSLDSPAMIDKIEKGKLAPCTHPNNSTCPYGLGLFVYDTTRVAFSLHGEPNDENVVAENEQYLIVSEQPCQIAEKESHPLALAKVAKACATNPAKTQLQAGLEQINHYMTCHPELYQCGFSFRQ